MISQYPLFEPPVCEKLKQAERTLALLEICDRSTLDLLVVGPRPAAYIRELRLRGWQIESKKENKVAVYHLVGKVPMVEVTDEMQSSYYQTQHWFETRRARMDFDKYRCAICQTCDELQVHHWQYDLFAENQIDLLTLCAECHLRIHQYPNVQCHFPRSVTPEVAERIQS